MNGFEDAAQSGRLSAEAVRGIADDLNDRVRDMEALARTLEEPGAQLEPLHSRQIADFTRHLAACEALVHDLRPRRAS